MKLKYSTIRAFTLIDILVSISIISFLSSIVIFNVTEGKTKAQDAQMKIESAQVATTVEMFKLDNDGKTPISVQMDYFAPLGIVPGEMYQEGTPQYETVMNKLVEEGYISEIPTSPDGDSYAYGETTDGTQAMFVAKLSSISGIENNTQTSCEFIPITQPAAEVVPQPCLRDRILLPIYSPTYDRCTYKAPTFTSEVLPDGSGTITITEPASWDCSNISYLTDPSMRCWESRQAGPFPDPCGIQGYSIAFSDGMVPEFNCPAPEPAKAYLCIGKTPPSPPPCDSAPPIEGYVCTNIDAEIYELCPIDQGGSSGESGGGSGNLCSGANGEDYCTCI